MRATALSLAVAALPLIGCGGDGPTPPDDGGGPAGEVVDLSVGELGVQTAGTEGLAFRVPGGAAGAEYFLAVQSTRQSTGFTALQLSVEGGQGASAARRPAGGSALSAGPLPPADLTDARRRLRSRELAQRIRESARRVLRRRNARPARSDGGSRRVSRRSLLPSDSVPEAGDTLQVRVGVQSDLSVTCDTTEADTVTSVVQAVGQEAALLADTAIADDAVDQLSWSDLADDFDRSLLAVPEAYFGEATDIDGNGRALLLFTVEVNKLTERDSDTRVGGFFLPTDLADSGDPSKDGSSIDRNESQTCPAGNEAEALYLLAPDPSGEFSDSVSVASALRNARGVGPHEFEHLINAGNRVIDQQGTFDQLETTWLDEALAHLSEEVVGLKEAGLSVRDNLTLEDAIDTREKVDIFNTFHLANFLRLRRFMINPDSTEALAARDPRGVESLEMRGFAYLFARWLGDQEGPSGSGIVPGSNEQALFQELARGNGQLLTGIENVESVTGEDWPGLIRDFATAVAADDTVATDPRLQVRTWDLRTLYRQLHEVFESQDPSDNPFPEIFPLEVTGLGAPADAVEDVELQGSAARYFALSPAAGDTLTVRLTDAAGSALPAGASSRVLLLRLD